MANDFFILKRGAVGSVLEFRLSDTNGWVDLSNYTVTVTAKKEDAPLAEIDDALCTADSDQSANKGKGTYIFDATTANIPSGTYHLEFKATDGTNVFIFPTDTTIYGTLTVQKSL